MIEPTRPDPETRRQTRVDRIRGDISPLAIELKNIIRSRVDEYDSCIDNANTVKKRRYCDAMMLKNIMVGALAGTLLNNEVTGILSHEIMKTQDDMLAKMEKMNEKILAISNALGTGSDLDLVEFLD